MRGNIEVIMRQDRVSNTFIVAALAQPPRQDMRMFAQVRVFLVVDAFRRMALSLRAPPTLTSP